MILCNGAPKSGTHLLEKCIENFDRNNTLAKRKHWDNASSVNDEIHLHIIRNHRNRLVSWIRFCGKEVTTHNLLDNIPFTLDSARKWAHWLDDPSVLTVRFEELLSDPTVLQKISEFINMPLVDNHFNKCWGDTMTFTGSLSNWRDYWTPEIEAEWVAQGGLEVEDVYNIDLNKKYKRYA